MRLGSSGVPNNASSGMKHLRAHGYVSASLVNAVDWTTRASGDVSEESGAVWLVLAVEHGFSRRHVQG